MGSSSWVIGVGSLESQVPTRGRQESRDRERGMMTAAEVSDAGS